MLLFLFSQLSMYYFLQVPEEEAFQLLTLMLMLVTRVTVSVFSLLY
jgi:hypothetical protein